MATVNIKTTFRKIVIAVSSGGITQFTVLCGWISGWAFGGGLLLQMFIRAWERMLATPGTANILRVLCYPTAFVCFGSIAFAALAFGVTRLVTILFTKEKRLFGESVFQQTTLTIEAETLTITRYKLRKRERRQAYALEAVSNIRLAQQGNRTHHSILFDEGNRSVVCCRGLQMQDALRCLHLFFGVIRFRCHSVERIVFTSGELAEQDSARTLWNPDVSSLTVPFVRLRQVWIVADAYDFHLTERFLTYAINVLGQRYMKRHVAICVHGDASQIQANLWNSLTNICREVQVYQSANPL